MHLDPQRPAANLHRSCGLTLTYTTKNRGIFETENR